MKYVLPAYVTVATPSVITPTPNFNGGDTGHMVTVASDQGLALTGTLSTGGSGGNLVLQWSADSSSTGTTVQQYSWIMLQRIG